MSLSYLKAFAFDSNFSSLGNTKHCMMVNTVDGEHVITPTFQSIQVVLSSYPYADTLNFSD